MLGTDGSPLTSNGNPLEYVSDGNGGVQAVVAGTSDVVFTVSVDPATGTYTVELGALPWMRPRQRNFSPVRGAISSTRARRSR